MKYLRLFLLRWLLKETVDFETRRIVSAATLTHSIRMPSDILTETREAMIRDIAYAMYRDGLIVVEHVKSPMHLGVEMRAFACAIRP